MWHDLAKRSFKQHVQHLLVLVVRHCFPCAGLPPYPGLHCSRCYCRSFARIYYCRCRLHTSVDLEGSSRKAGRPLRPFRCSSATRAGKLSTRPDTQGEEEGQTHEEPASRAGLRAQSFVHRDREKSGRSLASSSILSPLSPKRAPTTSFRRKESRWQRAALPTVDCSLRALP